MEKGLSETQEGTAVMKPAPAIQAPEPAAGSRRHAVVFADDDPQILLALERSLRHEPYELLLTTDPGKALDWIRSRPVSVVVADYRMPKMDGTKLLERILACSPRTARILLTGFPGEEPVRRARESGLLTLSAKPWNEKELIRTIRERIREREILDGLGSP
jgi:response regulator RpfG family c-di-GMP phosphodiesterase